MRNVTWCVALSLLALVTLLACSGGDGDDPRSVDAGGTGGVAGGEAAHAGNSASGGSADEGVAGSGGDVGPFDAPDEAEALLTFLEAKHYAGWAKEAESHPSAGPHGDGVRVYFSPKAAEALAAGAATFPAGAASVKELTSGGSIYGYSVWVKVQDAADSGNGFYWYERIQRGGGNAVVYGNARGSSACVGCHSAGKDYNLSTLPFE